MHCYGDEHRLFLQIMLNRRVLSLSELKEIIAFCHDRASYAAPTDTDAVKKFVQDMNTEITPFHMRIKHGVSEEDGEHFYALVNLKDDDLSKLATKFTGNEMKYFKILVEKIVESDSGTISSTVAINVADDMEQTRFSAADAELLIERFVKDGCLTEDQGQIGMSILSIMEMEPYLQDHFGERLGKCHACKRICIKGQKCRAPGCDVKMHQRCAVQLFGEDGSELPDSCPSCGSAWNR